MADNEDMQGAGRIIERFGGIRPMAERLQLPVTTIQGWKLSDTIPAAQRENVLRAASAGNVDLSDLGAPPPANENAGTPPPAGFRMPPLKNAIADTPDNNEAILGRIRAVENSAIQKSALLTLVMLILVAGAAAFLLWPDIHNYGQRLTTLEQQQAELQRGQAQEKILIPQQIQQGIAQFKASMNGAAGSADAAIGGNLQLESRVQKLETQVAALASPAALQAMMAKVAEFQRSAEGRQLLASAVSALNTGGLAEAPQTNDAAKQVLAGVAPADIKPAALLLGLAQLRSALGQDHAPFADGLGLIQKTLGGQDAALDASLQKLAPVAAKGVLTPQGLAAQFTPELESRIVAASLQGGGTQDHVLAHLNGIVQVRKDGNLLSGTDVQAAVDGAQAALARNDIAGAVALLDKLPMAAKLVATPWLEEADDTLAVADLAGRISMRAAVMLGGNGLQLTTLGGGVMNMTRDVQELTPGHLAPAVPITQPVQ